MNIKSNLKQSEIQKIAKLALDLDGVSLEVLRDRLDRVFNYIPPIQLAGNKEIIGACTNTQKALLNVSIKY